MLALFLAGFTTFLLLYCVQPLLPLLAGQFHVSPAESSLVLSLSTLLLAGGIVLAAALSDGVGRRGPIVVSLLAASGIDLATAFAPDWTSLLALRALLGAALGGVPAVAMATLAEEVEPASLGRAMGLYVGGTAFGGMLGRVAGGILAQAFGWRLAVGVVGAAGLAAAVGCAILLPSSRNFVRRPGLDVRHHAGAWLGHLRRPPMLLLFAEGFLVMGAFVAMFNYAGFRLSAPPYALSQAGLGLVFCVYLFGAVASPAAGALADRLGRRSVLSGALVVNAAGIALTLLPGLPAIIAGLMLLTIGFFAAHSVASGWVGRLAEGAKGHAASLYLLAYYLGASLLGSAAGWFLHAGGWPGVVGFTLGLLALAGAALAKTRQGLRS